MPDSAKIVYDSLIIGGGPTGLSAAIYTSRERMKTLVLDGADFGGMAAITERIENYPGFSKGVGGRQLIDEMLAQAKRFGAETRPFQEVVKLTARNDMWHVETSDQAYSTRSVLIASGSTYRKLGVPGEDELVGKGLHFCATCDAPLYRNKHVIVIGGGNSAMQESLFIARFATKVDILVRGAAFTGSDVLLEQLHAEKRITIHFNVSVESLDRPVTPGGIFMQTTVNDRPKTFTADGLFVFVGLLPNSHQFEDAGLDEYKFITSDNGFHTKLPGVFVAGDVRSGSTWQIGSAVGEGVSAALSMRRYLDDKFPGWHKAQ